MVDRVFKHNYSSIYHLDHNQSASFQLIWLPATYLHAIQGVVAADLKLLHQQLVLHRVDADILGQATRQDDLAIRTVAQGGEGPETTTRVHFKMVYIYLSVQESSQVLHPVSKVPLCSLSNSFKVSFQILDVDLYWWHQSQFWIPWKSVPMVLKLCVWWIWRLFYQLFYHYQKEANYMRSPCVIKNYHGKLAVLFP